MGRLFSTYVEFSEKLIYITPRYANIREHMHIIGGNYRRRPVAFNGLTRIRLH